MKKISLVIAALPILFFAALSAHSAQAQSTSSVTKSALKRVKTLHNLSSKIVRDALKPSAAAAVTPPLPRTVNCPNGGTATFNGDIARIDGGLTLTGQADLAACQGLTGPLTMDGSALLADRTLTSTLNLSGDLSGNCSANIPMSMTIGIQFDGLIAAHSRTASGTVTGTVDVSCGPLSIIHCSWDNVRLRDKKSLKAGCGALPVS